MLPRLHVNVDHVATIRQQRFTSYPDPVTAAALAELAGAHGITTHLREDRRHIQDRDVRILRETIQTHFNLEMAMTEEMQAIALDIQPDTVTLVPEKRQELTTEGGFDVIKHRAQLKDFVVPLLQKGIRVSLFIDPDAEQIEACQALDIGVIELSTASYVEAKNEEEQKREFERLQQAAQMAHQLGMEIAAGHGLDYTNVAKVATISEITEYNIGHSIVARAIFVGLENAIREMMRLLGYSI